jgi:1,2-diacylglycerol 3-beta-glucosyltransferase
METIRALAAAFTLFITAVFTVYVIAIAHMYRKRRVLTMGDPSPLQWHLLVPCMNEEAVIDETISRLTRMARNVDLHLWLIDDASDDGTRRILKRWARRQPSQVHLVKRDLPNARQGKSHALNHAYTCVQAWRRTDSRSRSSHATIIGVVDGDARLDPMTFRTLAGPECFGSPTVGAIQQDVRMHNLAPVTGGSRWARAFMVLQDIEFRASIAAIQLSRRRTQSVAMGGNGQWTRLQALEDAAGEHGVPWHGSLLEDFELGLHVLSEGWETRFTPDSWVSQEALPDLGRFLRQRTRWCQGSMQCARYLPKLWRSRNIAPSTLLEMTWYLAQPWLFIVGTFLYPIVSIDLFVTLLHDPHRLATWTLHDGGWMFVLVFAGLALGPLASWSFTYRRVCGGGARFGRRKALGYGLFYVLYVHLSYVVAWRSLGRLLLKRNSWVKTTRNAERPALA